MKFLKLVQDKTQWINKATLSNEEPIVAEHGPLRVVTTGQKGGRQCVVLHKPDVRKDPIHRATRPPTNNREEQDNA